MPSKKLVLVAFVVLSAAFSLNCDGAEARMAGTPSALSPSADDDLLFIHHSVGRNWLASGLEEALLQKPYIDERNDIYYGTLLDQDQGRPRSLGGTPGDSTDMHHWILWFNDYLEGAKAYGSETSSNRIIMFKSCFPNSEVAGEGSEPGDPFNAEKTLANYRAVYRNPAGAGIPYSRNDVAYYALEDVFAANPDILFVAVTANPRHDLDYDATTDENAHRARLFNNWLKNEWLPAYNAAHPGLNNVAVFDFFDVLAYPDDHPTRPNRLRVEYGGESGSSHPNDAAGRAATAVFAGEGMLLDRAWAAYTGAGVERPFRQYIPLCSRPLLGDGTSFAIALFEAVHLSPPWLLCS